ncbi:MAG: ABC transporter permease [Crenarchaeota archaeon]|nr:ABC transporter permease [Thermoproteota archaeon]MCR8471045.1 ABC transporter permease [Thermoproteota archaeon]
MSSSERISVTEMLERYKKVRRERRKYVVKQFFKIKRGSFGFTILVTLTILSILSPWIVPHPHDFKHAPLSYPEWARIFDPTSIGGDVQVVRTYFSQDSDVQTSPTSIPSIPTGVVYPHFVNPNGYLWPSLSHKLYIDKSTGAKTPDGAAVLEITDDTSKSLGILPPENYSYVTAGLCLNIHWEYRGPPYMIYAWFARKYEFYVPPIYKLSSNISEGGSISDNIYLYLSSSKIFTIKAQASSPVTLNVTITSDIEPARSYSGQNVEVNVKAKEYIAFSVLNTGPGEAVVNVEITWAVEELAEVFSIADAGLYIITSLWDPVKGKVINGTELREYIREKYGVVIPEVEIDAHEGLIQYRQKPIEKTWVNESYDIGRETEPTMLMNKKDYYMHFFQRGNITIVKFILKFRYASEDALKLRNMMKEPLVLRLLLDDIKLQAQDRYYGVFGVDDRGRDILSMIISGLKISLFVGFTAAFANIFIGVSLGLVAGYKGGRTDEVIMRICDFFMSIPTFPLLLVLAFIFNNIGIDVLWTIIIVLSILGWAGMSRTIRSQVLALRTSIYVEAAKASGASSFYVIRKHILPGVWPLVLMYIMVGVVGNILAEAGLTFLGVLVPKWDSLGRMIQEASGISPATGGGGGLAMERFHWLFFPGLVLMLIAYAFYAISDAYDELINPKRRRRF